MTSAPLPDGSAATQGSPGPLIRARGLKKAHGSGTGRVVALDGVDIDVRRGELLAVTGRSGSGKTTLLHCLSGLAAVDEGQVLLGEVDIAKLSDDARTELRAKRMSFVFQTLNLLPALTVAENVELPLVLRGEPADAIRTRASAALERVAMADRADSYPAQLSGGEQQRVAVARALVTDPEVIWADEPTGALDTASAAGVLELLRAAADAGSTVVVVSHAAEIADAADRTVVLRDGRLAG